jgi:predicted MFS family arabinose efflux permease
MSRDERLGVWVLAVGQTLGFATLVFSFGGILPALLDGSGWSRAELALGPTLALLVSAVLAPVSGRLVDAGHGAALLAGAAALGAAGLLALSGVGSHALWLACWALVGLGQAGSLYETCFAFLTRRLGGEARGAIIRITVLAGFASSLAFPVGAWAGAAFGWHGALAIFAALQLAITVPANLWGAHLLRRGQRRGPAMVETPKGAVRAAIGKPEFWVLAAIFALMLGGHMMLVSFALPIMQDRGAGATLAVVVASSVGPMQVAGRLFLMFGADRIGSGRAVRVITLGLAVASAALLLAAGQPALMFAYAVFQGASIGIASILRPLLVAEALGRENFGAVSGALATAPLSASAAAPYLGALLIGWGGVPLLLAATLSFALLAFAGTLWLGRRGI